VTLAETGRCYAAIEMASRPEPIVYCLTRDHELAVGLDARLSGAIGFFYNDVARLSQAVILRRPDAVVVDTGAIREEFGDGGLGPVIAFLAQRSPHARIAARPAPGADRLVAAEAGPGVAILPAERAACIEAVVDLCGQLA
jgi:hypothetical protein